MRNKPRLVMALIADWNECLDRGRSVRMLGFSLADDIGIALFVGAWIAYYFFVEQSPKSDGEGSTF